MADMLSDLHDFNVTTDVKMNGKGAIIRPVLSLVDGLIADRSWPVNWAVTIPDSHDPRGDAVKLIEDAAKSCQWRVVRATAYGLFLDAPPVFRLGIEHSYRWHVAVSRVEYHDVGTVDVIGTACTQTTTPKAPWGLPLEDA